MTLPNLVVIGAKKSGTTTLAINLAAHPDAYLAVEEVHFFDLDRNWNRGVDWYAEHFGRAGVAAVVGEKTPSYLHDPRVPARIAETFPTDHVCTFVAVLREPASRALSDVHHERRRGVETREPEDALRAAMTGDVDDPRFDYVTKGHYAEQLRRFMDEFGRENVHVEFYEDLVADPWAVYDRVFHVLGLAPFRPAEGNVPTNQSVRLLHPHAYRVLLHTRAGRWLPPSLGRRIWLWLTEPDDYEPLPSALEDELRSYYGTHNASLERLLGRPLPRAWTETVGR